MCGRYNFSAEDSTEIQRIIKDVSNSLYGQRIKTGEIFSTNIAPAITAIESEQRPTPMMWGFPHYKGKGVIINAKSETVTEKKCFGIA